MKSSGSLGAHLQNAMMWLRGLPHWVKIIGAVFVISGFAIAAMFVGFLTNQHQLFPAQHFAFVDRKIQKELFGVTGDESVVSGIKSTALLDIRLDVGLVDTWRPDRDFNPLSANGGGMTSFGEDILLLTYSGAIYAASSSSDIRLTRIAAPNQNRDAYLALINAPEMSEYNFQQYYLRYNDLTYFQSNQGRGLIASFTEYHPEQKCYTNSLAMLKIDPAITSADQIVAKMEDWSVFFRTAPCLPLKKRFLAIEGHMAAGRIAFQAPSTIFLASGDFHLDGMRSEGTGIAQDPTAEYGKVLSVDIDTGVGKIISSGHRNPQGIALTPDGRLFVAEHGPQGGDELNKIEDGANYGWPLVSYGTTYTGAKIPNSLSFGRHDGFEAPIFSWVPSLAVSSIVEIRDFDEAWDGDLLIGAMTDLSLNRVRLQEGRPVYSERIEIGARIRHLHNHTDGRIVAWTDDKRLIFISPEKRDDGIERFNAYLEESGLPERRKDFLRTAISNCAECHSFRPDVHTGAPGLGRIFGDRIASTEFGGYSTALRGKSGVWNRANLTAFISDPQGFADGASMPGQQFSDPATIADVIDYLESIDRDF